MGLMQLIKNRNGFGVVLFPIHYGRIEIFYLLIRQSGKLIKFSDLPETIYDGKLT